MINPELMQKIAQNLTYFFAMATLGVIGGHGIYWLKRWKAKREDRKRNPILTWVQTDQVLRAISYKHYVELGWFSTIENRFVLTVDANCQDADKPVGSKPVNLKGQYSMKLMSERDLIKTVHDALLEFEKHELDEFFRYKGVKVFDPHRPRSVHGL